MTAPDLNARQPQPVKVTTYPVVQLQVVPQPGGGCILVATTPHGEQIVFPMDERSAQIIGKALLAPRVSLPGDGRR
jgi:hypothetical protein